MGCTRWACVLEESTPTPSPTTHTHIHTDTHTHTPWHFRNFLQHNISCVVQCLIACMPCHCQAVIRGSWVVITNTDILPTPMSHIYLYRCFGWIPRDYSVIPIPWCLDLWLLVSCLPVFVIQLWKINVTYIFQGMCCHCWWWWGEGLTYLHPQIHKFKLPTMRSKSSNPV